MDATLTTAPRRSRSAGSSARAQRKAPSRLTPSTSSQTSSVSASRSAKSSHRVVPALLTSRSQRPNRSSHRRAIARTAASSRTSTCTASASAPAAVRSLTVCSASSAERLQVSSTPRAPARTNRCAVARPIPVPPPVTTATRPFRSIPMPSCRGWPHPSRCRARRAGRSARTRPRASRCTSGCAETSSGSRPGRSRMRRARSRPLPGPSQRDRTSSARRSATAPACTACAQQARVSVSQCGTAPAASRAWNGPASRWGSLCEPSAAICPSRWAMAGLAKRRTDDAASAWRVEAGHRPYGGDQVVGERVLEQVPEQRVGARLGGGLVATGEAGVGQQRVRGVDQSAAWPPATGRRRRRAGHRRAPTRGDRRRSRPAAPSGRTPRTSRRAGPRRRRRARPGRRRPPGRPRARRSTPPCRRRHAARRARAPARAAATRRR